MLQNEFATPGTAQTKLNDKLLQQNAELTQAVTSAADEKAVLRDSIRKLENENWSLKLDQPVGQQDVELVSAGVFNLEKLFNDILLE